MIAVRSIAVLLAAALMAGAPLSAARPATDPPVVSIPIKKEKFRFNPARGYILMRLGPVEGDKGKADFISLIRIGESSSLRIPRAAMPDIAVAGGGANFMTRGNASVYLVEVNPGYWAIAGTMGPGGIMTSMSLGSYAFDVKPGEVTDIGTIYSGREDGQSPIPEIARARASQDLLDYGTLTKLLTSRAMFVVPPKEGDVPPEFASLPVRRATLDADVRFDNLRGTLVNRVIGLPPMGHEAPRP